MKKVIVNKRFVIQARDVVKGLMMAAGTSVLTMLQSSAAAGDFTLSWQTIGMAAVSGGLTYILFQLIAPAQVTTVYDSNEKAKEIAAKIEKENG